MSSTNDRQLLHCRWNWCARTFELPSDLLSHLKSEHFRSILRVEKGELDEYLRCNEGRSGMTGMCNSTSKRTSEGAPVDCRQLASGPPNPVHGAFARSRPRWDCSAC